MNLIYSKDFKIRTKNHIELVDITDKVEEIVRESKISDGIAVIYSRHTTSAIIINENEGGLKEDLISTFKKIVPKGGGYKHDRIDNNAHSHIQASLVGPSETIPLVKGRLYLGSWQSIFFAEFDGPRTRTILVQITD
ncbi:MAG: secondary thiamine-phosphate synthase enzyme YjbQ [Candidatus Helarchaeota archaeon]